MNKPPKLEEKILTIFAPLMAAAMALSGNGRECFSRVNARDENCGTTLLHTWFAGLIVTVEAIVIVRDVTNSIMARAVVIYNTS